LDTDDDAICLKSNYYWPIKNISITNCNIGTNCNGIKTGTASLGGFRNITISNCVIHAAAYDSLRHWQKEVKGIEKPLTGISGIVLSVVDGGVLDGVTISNVVIRDMQTPLFVRIANRGRKEKAADPERPAGKIRNVFVSNLIASGHSHMSNSISGLPGYPVENITLSGVVFDCMGGGGNDQAQAEIPEAAGNYPQNRMYGWTLPAWGLWVRHVRGLTLDNVRLTLRQPDVRPAVRLDDATGIELKGIQADTSVNNLPSIIVDGKPWVKP